MNKPHIIELPRMYDPRGSLTFVEETRHVPFDIKRVYWIYDVPGGESRGAHSHKASESLIVAASGSFTVDLFDGYEHHRFALNKPFEGLYVPPGYWRVLDDFSSGSVCMVMTSTFYTEDDYERDFDRFMEWARSRKEEAI
ncbi:MAG: FdtA/QdtA family cupin domain-containing protein [Duncaniella sp.]|nr:FdtA/QdtA family cupin domain-containing protein [Duncaniella sp.]MDE5733692.1 FdtA/QdtA family cupin domain-containing protein [Duncaniella sp.]MDE6179517.1 FdtA/QdtA family cupin domain-containing protein [Duncaniella sp.]MDE6390006.1 FdtA/QdtA family cupin domain-containing protein [Duncaniella sp.]